MNLSVRLAKKSGQIRNEAAYRRSLENLAREGKLDVQILKKTEQPSRSQTGPEWLKDLKIKGTKFQVKKE